MSTVKLKITFRSLVFEADHRANTLMGELKERLGSNVITTGPGLELAECVQYPELAIVRTRERFLWKERFFVRGSDGRESELPSLKDALIFTLQQRNASDEEIKAITVP